MPQITVDEAMQIARQHHQAGRLAQAEQIYRQVLAQVPEHAPAIHDLGLIAQHVGRHDVAIDLIRRAIALMPTDAAAYSNLCLALLDNGRLEEAIVVGRKAIVLNPDLAEGHNNLGLALECSALLDEAIAAYRRAIALRPNYAETFYNLGNALKAKRQFEQAIVAYRQAIVLRPNYADAYNNVGVALKEEGQLDDSIVASRRALALSPTDAEAHSNLLLTLNYHPGFTAEVIADELHRWNELHARPVQQLLQRHQNDPDPDRRVKIGYVSPDFRDHVVGRNLLPLFREHDRDRFEVFCYSNVQRPDEMTTRFRSYCDGWRDIAGLSDQRVAEIVREDRIDILVDCTLHSSRNRLLVFARKPAPIQVTWAGYPGTTGLNTIDYRLTDPYLDPFDSAQGQGPVGQNEEFYSEQSIRLPGSFWCYDPAVMTAGLELGSRPGPLPALTSGAVTFGCLNNFCKINDNVLALWSRVLNAVGNSRLLLMAPEGGARDRTLEILARQGIDPGRINFVQFSSLGEYLRHYSGIDIVLDTFPYNGHTTSLDALWMGVPVVTLVGKTVVGRAGLSQLTNLKLTELVATFEEQYLRIAAELADELPRLAELCAGLRQRMRETPLTDATRFARNIEHAYRDMWRTWCQCIPMRNDGRR